jgi:hypothetical protein
VDSTAVLIDAKILRKRDAGQVDLAALNCNQLLMVEIKSGNQKGVSRKQLERLKRSAEILAHILSVQISLEYWFTSKNSFAKKIKVF